MTDDLTPDFTRSFPGGKLDDSAYEAIESALDRANVPCQDGARWMTLVERVDALATQRNDLLAELKWCFMGAGSVTRMAAAIDRAEGRS